MDGARFQVRELEARDAEAFTVLLEATDREARYLLYAHHERMTNPSRERARINWWRESPNSAILGAERLPDARLENRPDALPGAIAGPELAGYLFATGGTVAKNRHVMSVEGIAVLEKYQGRGVGLLLLAEAERRARAMGIVRLCLGVMEPNAPARALYRKAGFIEEARKEKAFILDGEYVAQIELVKFLD